MNKSSIKKPINGEQRRIVDFAKFIENYDTIQKQSFNKIFGQTKQGSKILTTLEDLRKIADYEDAIQENVLKRGQNLTEAVKVATEHKQSFLFGVEYFLRRYVVRAATDKIFRSEAYKTYINELAKKKRYGFTEIKKAEEIATNKAKASKLGLSAEDKTMFRTIVENVKQVQKEELALQKQAVAAMEKENTLKEKQRVYKEFAQKAKEHVDDKIESMSTNALPAPKNMNVFDDGARAMKNRFNNEAIQKELDENQVVRKTGLNVPTQEQLDRANQSTVLTAFQNEIKHFETPDIYTRKAVENLTEQDKYHSFSNNTIRNIVENRATPNDIETFLRAKYNIDKKTLNKEIQKLKDADNHIIYNEDGEELF